MRTIFALVKILLIRIVGTDIVVSGAGGGGGTVGRNRAQRVARIGTAREINSVINTGRLPSGNLPRKASLRRIADAGPPSRRRRAVNREMRRLQGAPSPRRR